MSLFTLKNASLMRMDKCISSLIFLPIVEFGCLFLPTISPHLLP